MTGRNRLTDRGANAKAPAKLPALAAARCDDPSAQRAIEALREWVEVRLGVQLAGNKSDDLRQDHRAAGVDGQRVFRHQRAGAVPLDAWRRRTGRCSWPPE